MNNVYELQAGYRLNPQASYTFSRSISAYKGTSPVYEQAMKEYQNIASQSLQNMRGDYNNSS